MYEAQNEQLLDNSVHTSFFKKTAWFVRRKSQTPYYTTVEC